MMRRLVRWQGLALASVLGGLARAVGGGQKGYAVWRKVAVTTGLLVVVGGVAVATGAIPAGDGTVRACYATNANLTRTKGDVRVVDEGDSCKANEKELSWNQRGQAGEPGPPGPPGPAGSGDPDTVAGPDSSISFTLEGLTSDEVAVLAFELGLKNEGSFGSGGGGGAGKVTFEDVQITKPVDKTTPKLLLAVATGEHFKKAVLHFRTRGEKPFEYLSYELTDVLVSSNRVLTPTSNGGPIERVSLSFAKIEIEQTEQGPDGKPLPPTKAGYDLKANKPE
jgi:type VI secretion system secreted protein Hcp